MQGQRLLTYGGERALAAEARPEPGEEDDEDDTETVGDASLLDADARCWAPVTLAGARARKTEPSCVVSCGARCWAPVTLAGARARKTEPSCVVSCGARCWAPVTLAGARAGKTEPSCVVSCGACCWAPVALAGARARTTEPACVDQLWGSLLLAQPVTLAGARKLSRALLCDRVCGWDVSGTGAECRACLLQPPCSLTCCHLRRRPCRPSVPKAIADTAALLKHILMI